MVAKATAVHHGAPLDAPVFARVPDPAPAHRTHRRWPILTAPRRRRSRRSVLEALQQLLPRGYANVHRGVYKLAERSTEAYDEARGGSRALLGR